MLRMQRTLTVAAAVGVLVAATACAHPSGSGTGGGNGPNTAAPYPSASAPSPSAAPGRATTGEYTSVNVTFGEDDAAINYDKLLVPDRARAYVAEGAHDGLTTVVLDVHGLAPNHAYGAHVHVKPCGPKPDDAGPHYQHVADPVKPSVNPAFANPNNEVWLDFTTDARGNATRATTVEWTFGATPAPGSVVIHAEPTKTGPGQAGMAGARAACVSVGF